MGKFVGSKWVPDYAGEAEPQRIGSRVIPSPIAPPQGPGSYRPPNGNTGVTGGMIGGQTMASPTAPPPATPPPPHIQNDYHAPDRAQVLADPSRWGPAPIPSPQDLGLGPAGTPGSGRPGPRIYGDWRDFQPGGAYHEAPAAAPAPPGGAPPSAAPTAPTTPPTTPQTTPQRPKAPGRDIPVPEGYDATKFYDPNLQASHKYLAGRYLSQGGNIDGLLQLPEFSGWRRSGTDKIVSPQGTVYDLYRDVGGANALQFTRIDGAGDADPRLNDGIRGNARGGGSGGGGKGQAGGGAGFTGQVRQILMQQLKGLSKPVGADDPLIAGEMQAQERILERNRQDRRASAAERAAMQGLLSGGQSSGAFDAEVASGYEDKGQALTGLQAQLFARELQGRRTQVANLLNMALQSGDAEMARSLQLQLANMDNELRRYGLQQQQNQFDDQFGLDAGRFQYQKDRDLALFGAGG